VGRGGDWRGGGWLRGRSSREDELDVLREPIQPRILWIEWLLRREIQVLSILLGGTRGIEQKAAKGRERGREFREKEGGEGGPL
jgi:hypothetical protein